MIHSSLEESLECTCPNCGQEHNAKFFSLFVGDMHYVVGDCDSCGYRIEMPRHDLGAGLFMPDGQVTTVMETFQQKHVGHMKDVVEEKTDIPQSVTRTFQRHKMRFLDDQPIVEQRER